MRRQNQLAVENRVAERKNNYEVLSNAVLELLGIAEKCFEQTQNTNDKNIEGAFLNELFHQFVENNYSK
jgi:hypothetical protein